MGQIRVDKTLELLKGKFFWSSMRNDVQRHYPRCISCFKTKTKAMSHELYTPSFFANVQWEDRSLDFILELPWTTKGFDSIFMDKLFSREVKRLHSLSPRIVLKRAPKFENHFWRILFEKLGTKLYSSNSYNPQTNGQNEIENIALSTMPRVIIKGKHNPRDEHAYKRVVDGFPMSSSWMFVEDGAEA